MLASNLNLRGSTVATRLASAPLPCLSSLHHASSAPTTAATGPPCCGIRICQGRRALLRTRDVGPLVCHAQPATTTSGLGLFPSAAQTRVQLPAVALQLEAAQVLADASITDVIGQALQGGCNMLVLWDSNANAAAMYDAALRLQELLRGRAALLLVDRTDIALAIGAQGVLLTDQGVPTVVAKRMLSSAGGGAGGGLVGRVVTEAAAAVTAAADGASLVLIEGPGGGAPSPAVLSAARSGQRSGNAIPILMGLRQPPGSGAGAAAGAAGAGSGSGPDSGAAAALGAELEGVAVSLAALPGVARACYDLPEDAGVSDLTTAILTRLNVKAATAGVTPSGPSQPPPPPSTSATAATAAGTSRPQPSDDGGGSAATNGTAASAHAAASPVSPAAAPVRGPAAAPPSPPSPRSSRPLLRLMEPGREALLAAEKELLGRVLGCLEQALPGVSELSLLRDALKALDEPFLVAVVGEFNSGKSSVINALLGRRYLAEGILPTTNEISILKYRQPQPAGPGTAPAPDLEQQADGLYVRYLPARLLQDLHIVDTPGTNVILERQQRLTEEYVPRADLVLFVLSADRPFSESEVRFLEYIRQWQKRVVFVVNKADILEGPAQVAEVVEFVADNATRILRLDRPAVIPVSSRAALRAKLAAAGLSISASLDGDGPTATFASPTASLDGASASSASASGASAAGGCLESDDELGPALRSSPEWRRSNFSALERQVSDFLVGGGSGGGEGVRLKLQTPLFVADALLGAAARRLEGELGAARAELEGVVLVGKQLRRFRAEMEKDAAAQRAALQGILNEVVSRAERFVDSTVQLSNAPTLLSIAAGNREYPFRNAFEKEVVGGALESLSQAVAEHSSWLAANCDTQRAYYAAFAASRAAAAGVPPPPGATGAAGMAAGSAGGNGVRGGIAVTDSSDRAASGALASPSSSSPAASPALAAVTEFNVRAVATLLDTELQAAMAGTAGSALGAPLFGLFAMQAISNTLEDLLLAGLSGAVSYVSLLNLPLRRADLKEKISRVAGNFVADVQRKMEGEVEGAVGGVVAEVAALMAPLEAAYAAEVARLEARRAELADYAAQLQDLQRRAANLD